MEIRNKEMRRFILAPLGERSLCSMILEVHHPLVPPLLGGEPVWSSRLWLTASFSETVASDGALPFPPSSSWTPISSHIDSSQRDTFQQPTWCPALHISIQEHHGFHLTQSPTTGPHLSDRPHLSFRGPHLSLEGPHLSSWIHHPAPHLPGSITHTHLPCVQLSVGTPRKLSHPTERIKRLF